MFSNKIDSFTKQYLVTALWSSTDDFDQPLDKYHDIENLSHGAFWKAVEDCAQFKALAGDLICEENFTGNGYDTDLEGRFGHDFWLTRNHRGAGFWDGDYKEPAAQKLTAISRQFKGLDLYAGSDGKIYFL